MRFPANVRVFMATARTDMRKQMNGLSILVREGLGRDPRSGEMFVFLNRRGDMMRVLFYDQQGYCLLSKRMDRGVFKVEVPESSASSLELAPPELGQLLAGVRLDKKMHSAA